MRTAELDTLIEQALAKLPEDLRRTLVSLRGPLSQDGVVQARTDRRRLTTYRVRCRRRCGDGTCRHVSLSLGSDPGLAQVVAAILRGMKTYRSALAWEAARVAREKKETLRRYRRLFLQLLHVGRRVRQRAVAEYDQAVREGGLSGAYSMMDSLPLYEAQSRPGAPARCRYW